MKKVARKRADIGAPTSGALLSLLHAIVRRDLREFVVDAGMAARRRARAGAVRSSLCCQCEGRRHSISGKMWIPFLLDPPFRGAQETVQASAIHMATVTV